MRIANSNGKRMCFTNIRGRGKPSCGHSFHTSSRTHAPFYRAGPGAPLPRHSGDLLQHRKEFPKPSRETGREVQERHGHQLPCSRERLRVRLSSRAGERQLGVHAKPEWRSYSSAAGGAHANLDTASVLHHFRLPQWLVARCGQQFPHPSTRVFHHAGKRIAIYTFSMMTCLLSHPLIFSFNSRILLRSWEAFCFCQCQEERSSKDKLARSLS